MVSTFVHDPPFMRQSRTQKGSVDYLGILLLISSLGVLQIVLDRGQRADWFNSPWVVYASALSGLAFVCLVHSGRHWMLVFVAFPSSDKHVANSLAHDAYGLRVRYDLSAL
jgi:hypothetical protein